MLLALDALQHPAATVRAASQRWLCHASAQPQTLLTPLMWMAGGLGLATGCLCGWGAHEEVGYEGLSDEARRVQLSIAIVCGGIVGYLVMALGTSTVEAGCKTLFVCFAEEPTALRDLAPELYATFNEAAPIKGTDKDKTAPLVAP